MRLPSSRNLAVLGEGMMTLALAAGLAACTNAGGASPDVSLAQATAAPRINGPQADYPIRVGDPYTIAGTEYVPTDTMNYDHVGYLAVDADATGYTGSHHTLPLPSYAEVTSLESGRTILVRLERRGPMTSNHLLALAPAALAQLEATAETPVRVRRVNPPEDQRALLRAGNAAPSRMDTPTSLLAVLQRRLPASGAVSLQAPEPPRTDSVDIETVGLAASQAVPVLANEHPERESALVAELAEAATANDSENSETFVAAFSQTEDSPATALAEQTPAPEPEGVYVVQAAAFSTMERAQRVANAIGGVVTQYGQFYRVRTGPFATRGEAEASLANVRRAGYSDARILTNG